MDKCKIGYWRWLGKNINKALHIPIVNGLIIALSLCGIGGYFKNIFVALFAFPVSILSITYQIYKDEKEDC